MTPLTVTASQLNKWFDFLLYQLEPECRREQKPCPGYWQFALTAEPKISVTDSLAPNSRALTVVTFQRRGESLWVCTSHELTLAKEPESVAKVTRRDVIVAALNELNKN